MSHSAATERSNPFCPGAVLQLCRACSSAVPGQKTQLQRLSWAAVRPSNSSTHTQETKRNFPLKFLAVFAAEHRVVAACRGPPAPTPRLGAQNRALACSTDMQFTGVGILTCSVLLAEPKIATVLPGCGRAGWECCSLCCMRCTAE